MAFTTVRNRYVDDGAGVVPKPRLLTMVYDKLVLDLEQAEEAVAAGNIARANDRLCHAQDIFLELQSALDLKAWEPAINLMQLYEWFNIQLVEANVTKNAKGIRICLHLVRQLQDAWHKAYAQVMADSVSGGTTDTVLGARDADRTAGRPLVEQG